MRLHPVGASRRLTVFRPPGEDAPLPGVLNAPGQTPRLAVYGQIWL